MVGGLSQVSPLADNITSGGGGEEASYEGYKPDDPVYCLPCLTCLAAAVIAGEIPGASPLMRVSLVPRRRAPPGEVVPKDSREEGGVWGRDYKV